MRDAFRNYIELHGLCEQDDQIMLAVSGGIDSVVMTDLFHREGFSCIVLHCNFKLRDEESDLDEAFVRQLAAQYDFPVFVQHFETESYASNNGISIQMAAREMRYDWFDAISDEREFETIATAHNLNDSVETALINLSRGTGIKGITGIPVTNGKYIRPLLFAGRGEIVSYCNENHLRYREDSSNASKKYRRNKIRHDIIPAFEEINPSFIQTMNDNMRRFDESYQIYRDHVILKRNELFIEKEDHIEVDLHGIKQLNPLSSWLYELFSDYGFSMDQCLNIRKILNSSSGRQFISPAYRLFKDRENLLLYKVEESSFERYYIDSPDSSASLPFSMDIEVFEKNELEKIPSSSNIACLDLDHLKFPLILRKWQHGDFFYPLGMDQMKKVSDFFIDEKIPIPVKQKTWILTSGNKIVWITGQRIDNRFKIKDETEHILKLIIYD